MERRAKVLGHLLLAAGVLMATLAATPPAEAQEQQPRLAISEVNWEVKGPDRTREFWEVANLGDQPWNPTGFWAVRLRPDAEATWVRIQGVDPIPPNGVLLMEWGRPLDEGDLSTRCQTQGNVFCTTRTGFGEVEFQGTELHENMALAIFAPTANNEPPTIEAGTMLAYYIQVQDPDDFDREALAFEKAQQAGLWKGPVVGSATLPLTTDWAVSLRMGRGAYPPDHGRSADDYVNTLHGITRIEDPGLDLVSPPAAAPQTQNRAGTPGQPNFLHPGLPIPGHLTARFFAVRVQAFPVSLAQNAPPAAMQVIELGNDGRVATSVFSNNNWTPLTVIEGATNIQNLVLLNNPQRASRTLLLRTREGALSAVTATGEQPFGAATPLNANAQFAPVGVVNPTTGAEHLIAVQPDTGQIVAGVFENGQFRGFQPIEGATTNAPVAAAFTTEPAGLNVLFFAGNQLVLRRMQADGTFGPAINIGAALANRLEGMAPVLVANPQARRLEAFVLTGTAENPELQHARIELTAEGQANVTAFAKIADIPTSVPPAVAVNPTTGQVRVLIRHGGQEPGLNPRTDLGDIPAGIEPNPGNPLSGFVFVTTFNGSTWSEPQRLGLGRLPGPSPATPEFQAPVPPETIFDANTSRFHDFLIASDGQAYHNPAAQ